MQIYQRLNIGLLLISALVGCSSLPKEIIHIPSETSPQKASYLSQLSSRYWLNTDTKQSTAVLIQEDGWSALAQRLALIDAAERSIDIQYYIWNSDSVGLYLAQRLKKAADRGVQVRVMLDDINLNEREDLLAALDNHPKIEIRIFNPTPSRHGLSKWLSFAGDFSRLNRRMHNKSLTVDNSFSVVGGRNIGEEYFDLSKEINFRDRDVLVMGNVVSEIQTSFGQYWNSDWSYPITLLSNNALTNLNTHTEVPLPYYKHYPTLPQGSDSAAILLQNIMKKMIAVDAHFYYDQPVPANSSDTNQPKATARLLEKLTQQAKQQVLIESAYLIFDKRQMTAIQNLTENNIQIKAITNSMSSNDLLTNHSGYAATRNAMMEHGIELFELKPDSELCQLSTKDSLKCPPHSAYGLHAKSAVFDHEIATIGSFNFNLRSTYLNTESVLVINNDQIAASLAKNIEHAMQGNNSWQLYLENGETHWKSGTQYWDDDPETDQWERIKSKFIQLLPIEKYL